jgi:hypothetical protein
VRDEIARFLFGDRSLARLAAVRIVVPLVILSFLLPHLIHADDWLTRAGFQVPRLPGDDYRQPLYLAPLPSVTLAWIVVAITVCSGLALSAGLRSHISGGIFAAALVYLALADRLATFTVGKLGAVVVIALAISPAGECLSVDHPRRDAIGPGGTYRFLQLLLLAMYLGAGIAKARGDWLDNDLVVWSQLHDSYQSGIAYFLARHVPRSGWVIMQYATLTLELGAPLWLTVKWTRPAAVIGLLGMHLSIALLFPVVRWFSFLMMTLLACGYLSFRSKPGSGGLSLSSGENARS